ncbi:MAG: T9SS type A sorting domain-containing protein [candidate division WOR-3 bacterium]
MGNKILITILTIISILSANAVTDYVENPSPPITSNIPPSDININYEIVWSIPITSSVLALGVTPVCIGTYPAGETLLWVSHGGTSSSTTTDNWIVIYNLNTRTLVDSFPQPANSGWGYRDMCFYNGYVYAGYEGYIDKIDPITKTVVGHYSFTTTSPPRALADNNVEDSLWTANFTTPIYKLWNQGGTGRQVAPAVFAIYGLAYDPNGYMWGFAQNPMSTLVRYTFPSFASYDSCQVTEIINPLGDSAIAGGCEMWRDSFLLILGQAKPLDKVYCLRVHFPPPSQRDVGVNAIISPGLNIMPNVPVTPIARVKNFGSLAQTNIPVICTILGTGGILRYTNTQTIPSLAAGDTVRVNFAPWTPMMEEVCTVIMRTALPNDSNPANDRMTSTTNVTSSIEIIIGTGTSGSSLYTMYGYYAYSASEAIYLQSEINYYGRINKIAFYKTSGTNTTQFDDVRIFMKHTPDATIATGAFDTTGYTLVYSGPFPINAVGWMEVNLTNPFIYNNIDNLSVLILKGPPAMTSGYPSFQYTTTSPSYRNRYGYNASAWPTSLTQTYYRTNVRLNLTPLTPPAKDVAPIAILSPMSAHNVNTPMTPRVRVKNYGSQAQSFPVICSILGAGGAFRYTATANVNNLAPTDTTSVAFASWTPTISEQVTIIMRTALANDTNPANDRITRTTLVGQIAYQDFEASDGGYIADPPDTCWQWGTPTNVGPSSAYSGTKCWGTKIASNYSNSANWKLTSVPFIANVNNPVIKFYHWYSFEGTTTRYDAGNVKLSIAGGPWTVISPVGGYGGVAATANVAIPGESAYVGPAGTFWQEATFNIPVNAGQTFQIRWHFGSDPSVASYPGWYVDDVMGIGCAPLGLQEEHASLPIYLTTLNNVQPNPVKQNYAKISFTLASPSKLSLKIYDATGRLIKTLVNTNLGHGNYEYLWNCRDENNQEVAEGIYFYTLETENTRITKKLILTK